MKKNDFMRSEGFKILRKVTANSVNDFKYVVSVRRGVSIVITCPGCQKEPRYPTFCTILTKFGVSGHFRRGPQCQISRKYVQWYPLCCMRTSGRTNTMRLIVAFSDYSNASKSQQHCPPKLEARWCGPVS